MYLRRREESGLELAIKSKEDTCLALGPVIRMRKKLVITLISCRGAIYIIRRLEDEWNVQQRD